jgi:hypothetical protein
VRITGGADGSVASASVACAASKKVPLVVGPLLARFAPTFTGASFPLGLLLACSMHAVPVPYLHCWQMELVPLHPLYSRHTCRTVSLFIRPDCITNPKPAVNTPHASSATLLQV